MKEKLILCFLIFSYCGNLYASDFVKLAVLLGAMFAMGANMILAVWACIVARNKGHNKIVLHWVLIVAVTFLSRFIMNSEESHLAKTDLSALSFSIYASGVMAFLAPLFVKKRES